ncbi:hypothetical protein BDW_13270 [Bdellovibrio bacteriovorus W]|nr:hypothetical protein BDW_13270 [Bdellovibrio bacteriovorus W]
MIQYIEIVCQYGLGIQLLYWGLNGFFQWKAPPPSDPRIDAFVAACAQTGFIMFTVKVLEILIGLALLFNIATALALVALAPLIFVISGLHLKYNPRPWGVLGLYTIPFLIVCYLHFEQLLRLVH